MKFKLGLPLLTQSRQCLCGKTFDIFGHHAFSCVSFNKTPFHHRLRDTLFYVLQKLAPTAGLCLTETDVTLEPTSIIPTLPTRRPADVAIRLLPQTIPGATHLLIDVTSIPFPNEAEDLDPNTVFKLHQEKENKKFAGPSKQGIYAGDYPKALIRNRFAYLPFTFDPGGIIGPASSGFLWPTRNKPTTQPQHTITPLYPSNPHAQTLHQQTYSQVSSIGLFNKADIAWQSAHETTWFAPHYTATTPSTWAFQTFAQNFLLASTRHLLTSLHNVEQHKGPRLLHAAECIPPTTRTSIILLPTKYYLQTNSSSGCTVR